ncbi:hypothetical protein IW262DRAFT_1297285 [Armillaria fumosa]|nr:hypothetical protein IW262DRAFT_1297285 [Armillaria fumosa]
MSSFSEADFANLQKNAIVAQCCNHTRAQNSQSLCAEPSLESASYDVTTPGAVSEAAPFQPMQTTAYSTPQQYTGSDGLAPFQMPSMFFNMLGATPFPQMGQSVPDFFSPNTMRALPEMNSSPSLAERFVYTAVSAEAARVTTRDQSEGTVFDSPLNNISSTPTPLPAPKHAPQAKNHAIMAKESDGLGTTKQHKKSKEDKKLCMSDLIPARRRIVNAVFPYLRSLMIHNFPWLEDSELEAVAIQAWYAAVDYMIKNCNYVGHPPPTQEEIVLTDTVYRSQTVRSNTMVISKVMHDPMGKLNLPGPGYYQSPLIGLIINQWYFNEQHGKEGVRLGFFLNNEIPFTTIALVLAAVECAIDEYETGKYKMVKFFTENYGQKEGDGAVYMKHLNGLREWEAAHMRARSEVSQCLRKDLFADGKKHAGVIDEVSIADSDTLGPRSMFTAEDFALDICADTVVTPSA